MKYFQVTLLLILGIVFTSCSKDKPIAEETIEEIEEFVANPNAEIAYFPPIDSDTWETVPLPQLEWNEDKADDLFGYLEEKDTKGFMILYKGRIVSEKYFNGHSKSDLWFWNSAAKSLTGAVVGIAKDEGLLDLNDKTSDHLGSNWSTLAADKQDLITVKHHLSMNTGLDAKISQPAAWTCTLPTCLEYKTDAGDSWAYHQGAFSLLFDIVSEATSMEFSDYSKTKMENKIGMQGSWEKLGFLSRYQSDTRSMARFGLLMMNSGVWNAEVILSEDYFNAMINTSQNSNLSFGYLWWLNGKENYMGTNSQEVFTGSLIPNAPTDMYSALGANDQKIYVIPSKNLVIVRTGDSAGAAQLGPSSFDNELWEKINEVLN